jgi:hypothetical protein
MQIELLSAIPPKTERPATTGAAVSAEVEFNLLSNTPEIPVQPVSETANAEPVRSNRAETVWSESDRRAVFRVLNEHTGEVVSQIPTDEVLRVSRNIDEFVQDAEKKVDLET